jgi:hypothetical protein
MAGDGVWRESLWRISLSFMLSPFFRGPLVRLYFAPFVACEPVPATASCGWFRGERLSTSATATPDEQAANGPLVGDPTLISGEQACEKDNPNEPWYPTIAAFEVYDSARTHLYSCAHFLGSLSSPSSSSSSTTTNST